MATPPNPTDSVDYSASATLVYFSRPVPLLRIPIPAGLPDDPSSGPVVLAFRDTQSWTAAFKSSESQITTQCEAGIRIGCSVNASNKCSSPWWKNLFGVSKIDFAEREKCEEREMAICVESSIAKCHKFAKDKCLPAFRDARIAISNPKQDKSISHEVQDSPDLLFLKAKLVSHWSFIWIRVLADRDLIYYIYYYEPLYHVLFLYFAKCHSNILNYQ